MREEGDNSNASIYSSRGSPSALLPRLCSLGFFPRLRPSVLAIAHPIPHSLTQPNPTPTTNLSQSRRLRSALLPRPSLKVLPPSSPKSLALRASSISLEYCRCTTLATKRTRSCTPPLSHPQRLPPLHHKSSTYPPFRTSFPPSPKLCQLLRLRRSASSPSCSSL